MTTERRMTEAEVNETSLDNLVQATTAFTDWNELATQMEAGYVPTLQTQAGRSNAQRNWNDKVCELAIRIEMLGYRVFRGNSH